MKTESSGLASIEAIIFDLDGVLIDSASAHERAFREAFRRFPNARWHYAEIAGMRTDEAMRMILSREKFEFTEEDLRELVEDKRRRAKAILKETKPVPADCVPVVRQLSEKYKLGIATSASRGQLEHFFEIATVEQWFKATVSGEEVDKAKPDPEIFLACAKKLRVPPKKALVIEDSLSGLRAANAAGSPVFWMDLQQFRLPDDVKVAGVIHNLTELGNKC